jgi:hypothetical protein
MTFFPGTITKVPLKFLIYKKNSKVTVLNGYVAGKVVDNLIEIQSRDFGSWVGFIYRMSLFWGHNLNMLKKCNIDAGGYFAANREKIKSRTIRPKSSIVGATTDV